MGPIPKTSAEAAYAKFLAFLDWAKLLDPDAPDLSEADTRCKLIDPLFRDVLGWTELDITREEPVAVGFADYSFGTGFKWFHVEAKRAKPRFKLYASSRKRTLSLSGTHLLDNTELSPLLEQAAKYSVELGTEFALLTNGSQFIIFRALARGHGWRKDDAVIWHDYEDIKANFAEFYWLLSRESVTKGILAERFSTLTSVTSASYTPLQFIHNPDVELVRNPFWSKISRVFTPLLTDQPTSATTQEEIIRYCYVQTPISLESNETIDRLIRDNTPQLLQPAGVTDIAHEETGPGSFVFSVVNEIKLSRPGTYILIGGVGSGKTTYLKRFAYVDKHEYIDKYCVWLHIDFRDIGDPPEDKLQSAIEEYTNTHILAGLKGKYQHFLPKTGEDLRALFDDEIKDTEKTLLFGVAPSSERYRDEINALVSRLVNDTQACLRAVLRNLQRNGRCIVFVLDNTDQQGEAFQKAVFLYSQRLSATYSTLTIVSLREEKFFSAYRQGVFDAYGTRKFHIGSPAVIDVIRQRLEYGLVKFTQEAARNPSSTPGESLEVDEAKKVVRTLIDVSTEQNNNIVRMLTCVSTGNMRLALDMYRDFMSSGNTDVEKIVRIVRDQEKTGSEPYRMPFHEFAKAVMLGSRRYYRASSSRILNLFSRTSAASASHWTAPRLLARLLSAETSNSPRGSGFLLASEVLREWRESFGRADDLLKSAATLLTHGLIESDPPRSTDLDSTEAVKITATGAYYFSYLVRAFAYLDLVFLDTPVPNMELAKELADLASAEKGRYSISEFARIRIRRVLMFLDYLQGEDECEITLSRQQNGPYQEILSATIRAQVLREIEFIKRRTGA